MPKGTRVHRCVDYLKHKYGYGPAIGICQKSTKQDYMTGKKMRKKSRKKRGGKRKKKTRKMRGGLKEEIQPFPVHLISIQSRIDYYTDVNVNVALNQWWFERTHQQRANILQGRDGTIENPGAFQVFIDTGILLLRNPPQEQQQGGKKRRGKKTRKKRGGAPKFLCGPDKDFVPAVHFAQLESIFDKLKKDTLGTALEDVVDKLPSIRKDKGKCYGCKKLIDELVKNIMPPGPRLFPIEHDDILWLQQFTGVHKGGFVGCSIMGGKRKKKTRTRKGGSANYCNLFHKDRNVLISMAKSLAKKGKLAVATDDEMNPLWNLTSYSLANQYCKEMKGSNFQCNVTQGSDCEKMSDLISHISNNNNNNIN